MLSLLLVAWLAPSAHAIIEQKNICDPVCDTKIIYMESEIEPGWLVAEDRRVGGLRSLEVTLRQIAGRMTVTVNGYELDSRYLVSEIRGISTYRVPVDVSDTVAIDIANTGTDPIQYDMDITGSNLAPPS